MQYKNIIKILGIVTIAVLLTSITANISSAAIIDDECEDKIIDSIRAQVSKIDKDKAKVMADNDDRAKALTKDYVKEFNVIFYTYSIDASNCIGSLNNVNVHYIINKDNKPIKTLAVIIDDKISKVEEVREGDIIYAGSQPNWAGYQFKGNSTATNPIYESKARYYIPTVSKPTYPTYYDNNNACRVDLGRNPCILSIWTGLSDNLSGDRLAQGGNLADVRCNSNGCSTEYYLFFEFFDKNDPQPATECRSNPPYNAGDYISARVTNDKKYGGSSTSYDIMITDYTLGVGCGVFDYNFGVLSNPTYANYIYERSGYQTVENYATLPKFTDNTMEGWLYYDNSQKSIQEPYNLGWSYSITMINNNNINIDPTFVNADKFTADYKNSKGT